MATPSLREQLCNELKDLVGNEVWVIKEDEDDSDHYSNIETKYNFSVPKDSSEF